MVNLLNNGVKFTRKGAVVVSVCIAQQRQGKKQTEERATSSHARAQSSQRADEQEPGAAAQQPPMQQQQQEPQRCLPRPRSTVTLAVPPAPPPPPPQPVPPLVTGPAPEESAIKRGAQMAELLRPDAGRVRAGGGEATTMTKAEADAEEVEDPGPPLFLSLSLCASCCHLSLLEPQTLRPKDPRLRAATTCACSSPFATPVRAIASAAGVG